MISPDKIDHGKMSQYEGIYGERTILIENDKLWYMHEGSSGKRLMPLGNHVFFIEGTNSKIEFTVEEDQAGSMRIFGYNGKGNTYMMDK